MYTNLFLAGEPSRVLKVEKAREADPLSTKFLNSKQRISVIPKNKKSIPTNTDEWMSFRREKHFLIAMYSDWKGNLGVTGKVVVVKLLLCDREVTSSSSENNLLQK